MTISIASQSEAPDNPDARRKVDAKLNASDFSESLFLRDEGLRGRDYGLPNDVLAQSARRLRILALLYAFVFFMAAFSRR